MSEKMTADQALDRLKSIYLNRDGSYTVGHKFLYEFEVIHAELESLRRDAERYRWLRCGDNDEGLIRLSLPIKMDGLYVWLLRNEDLDAAIDAALESNHG